VTSRARASLTTRPVRFTGRHLFVNANIAGEVRVDVLDRGGRFIEPFSSERMTPLTGDSTRHRVTWRGQASLDAIRNQPVRFRFTLSRADLFAFWVSATEQGQSGGYLAAGGPGFSRPIDTP
jgi:hypothetical protein